MHRSDFLCGDLCVAGLEYRLMHLSMLSPRVGGGGGGGGRATHGKLTERAFPRVGNLTWPPSWKTERNWK